jgi:hypothetical protein
MKRLYRRECAAGLLMLCVVPTGATAAPKIFVDKDSADLGNIKDGEPASHSFVVENRGDTPLELKSVRFDAPGTWPDLLAPDRRTVQPGKSVEVPVQIDTKSRAGRISSRWVVTSNDPVEPSLSLRVSATVVALYTVTPAALYFRSVRAGEVIPNAILLMPSANNAKLEVTELKSDTPGLEVTTEPQVQQNAGRTGVSVKAKVEEGVPLGLVRATLNGKVKVGDEEKEIHIPVQGQVVGDVMLIPPWIALATPVARDKPAGEVILRANEGVKVMVKEAVSRSPYLRTEVVEQETDKYYRVKMTLAPNVPGGPLATVVDIYTTSKDMPIASVPVFLNVDEAVQISPSWVYLGAGKERTAKRLITLTVPTQAPLTVGAVQCDDPGIEARVVPNPEKKNTAQVEVELKDNTKPADHHAMLKIKTNIPGAESLTVPVVSMVEEGKQATPVKSAATRSTFAPTSVPAAGS